MLTHDTPAPLRTPLRLAIGLGLVFAFSGAALAQGEPPIKSAQDAACRDEARDRVFSTPDPQGLGLHAIGKQIYTRCMQRTAPRASGSARRARHAN